MVDNHTQIIHYLHNIVRRYKHTHISGRLRQAFFKSTTFKRKTTDKPMFQGCGSCTKNNGHMITRDETKNHVT